MIGRHCDDVELQWLFLEFRHAKGQTLDDPWCSEQCLGSHEAFHRSKTPCLKSRNYAQICYTGGNSSFKEGRPKGSNIFVSRGGTPRNKCLSGVDKLLGTPSTTYVDAKSSGESISGTFRACEWSLPDEIDRWSGGLPIIITQNRRSCSKMMVFKGNSIGNPYVRLCRDEPHRAITTAPQPCDTIPTIQDCC